MKTRILTLALALLFIVQVASAAAIPSVTTGDLYTVEVTKADGSPVPAGLVIMVIPETETALAELEKVIDAMKGDKPVTKSYFAPQQVKIRKVLRAKTDLKALQLKELDTLYVSSYTESLGDLTARLTFPTLFEADKPVVVMVGLVGEKFITWEALADVANGDGSINVILTKDLLLAVLAGNAIIAVLQ